MAAPEPADPFRREDFYVEAECCIACGVPQAVNPDLISWREVGNLLRAIGSDNAGERRMAEANALGQSGSKCVAATPFWRTS